MCSPSDVEGKGDNTLADSSSLSSEEEWLHDELESSVSALLLETLIASNKRVSCTCFVAVTTVLPFAAAVDNDPAGAASAAA